MNKRMFVLLISIATIDSATAYYDQYGVWHSAAIDNAVERTKEAGTNILDAVTGGRYSDTPKDREARIKAERKLEDRQRSDRRKYQDETEKIQRKKEDRRIRRME